MYISCKYHLYLFIVFHGENYEREQFHKVVPSSKPIEGLAIMRIVRISPIIVSQESKVTQHMQIWRQEKKLTILWIWGLGKTSNLSSYCLVILECKPYSAVQRIEIVLRRLTPSPNVGQSVSKKNGQDMTDICGEIYNCHSFPSFPYQTSLAEVSGASASPAPLSTAGSLDLETMWMHSMMGKLA